MALNHALKALLAFVAFSALLIGPIIAEASPASFTASGTYIQYSGLSATIRWASGTDNGSPVVWVCTSTNGNPPLPLDSGAFGSLTANFVNSAPVTFGLYMDPACTTSFHNQTVTVTR
ncbi:MAG: hypothetical protein ACR2M3_21620 [Thermomicrobiales bacterium]|nr:MAG: hypothetical protein DLM70_10105 [Chloroflexota bacterium]